MDPSRRVHVSFDLKYIECDLADERVENRPVIKMFLSSHFNFRDIKDIALDEHDLSKDYPGTLTGTLDRKHKELSPMAAIGIDSFAVHYNDLGHRCYVNVGTNHIFLGNVIEEIKTKGYYDHAHDLVMRTVAISGDEPIVKGRVEIRIKSVEMGPGVKLMRNGTSPLQAPLQQIEATLSGYIEKCMQLETRLPDTLDRTENIRAPMDISQVGIESTGSAFLPIAAFGIIEAPQANADFFRNSFNTILEREGRKKSDFIHYDTKEKCRAGGLILTYPIQSLDYISDGVIRGNRRMKESVKSILIGTEEFSSLLTTLAGDCEDGARSLAEIHKALIGTQFDPRTDKELCEIQKLMKQYVPMQTLAVVHGAKVDAITEARGAHMYLVMMPIHQLIAGCERTTEGRQFLQRMRPIEPVPLPVGGSLAGGEEDLVVPLALEGTGHADPLGRHDPLLDQRRYVMQNMKSAQLFKIEIPREEQAESTFYLADEMGVCGHFMEEQGINTGVFTFGIANPRGPYLKPGEAEMTRGAYFIDRHLNKDNLAIMPHPIMPEPVMNIIRESVSLRPPPRNLYFYPDQPKSPETHRDLDNFVKAVRALKRTGNKAAGSIDLWARPHHLNADVTHRMAREVAQMDRIFDADYKVEHITNVICAYRISLYVK